jgi:hypothetical protein
MPSSEKRVVEVPQWIKWPMCGVMYCLLMSCGNAQEASQQMANGINNYAAGDTQSQAGSAQQPTQNSESTIHSSSVSNTSSEYHARETIPTPQTAEIITMSNGVQVICGDSAKQVPTNGYNVVYGGCQGKPEVVRAVSNLGVLPDSLRTIVIVNLVQSDTVGLAYRDTGTAVIGIRNNAEIYQTVLHEFSHLWRDQMMLGYIIENIGDIEELKTLDRAAIDARLIGLWQKPVNQDYNHYQEYISFKAEVSVPAYIYYERWVKELRTHPNLIYIMYKLEEAQRNTRR